MTPVETGQPREGKRVLVLWLCWVVLALFLVAAGVMAGI